MPDNVDVLIVGAGAAGLSTAAALGRRGITARLIDRDTTIGGSWARRYAALHLHTIRRFSGLAHYPIPADRPQYLSKDAYAAYLRGYAARLGLDVVLGQDVQSVQPASRAGGGWEVVSSSGAQCARAVVVATGLYAEPLVPAVTGSDQFTGTLLHAAAYHDAAPYLGKRVLVVGLGNSGAEIAADLAAHGAGSVCVSIRTPPPIVSREMFGFVPVQLFGIALSPVGLPRIVDRVSGALRRLSLGDLTRYGLQPATWGPFTEQRPAVIDTGFLKQLKLGRIDPRPATAGFDMNEVIYSDGRREEVDAVIMATGYRTGLGKLLGRSAPIDAAGRPVDPLDVMAAVPGLYFVGFTETVRGQLFEINRQSRRVAADIDTFLRKVLPD
ncbi:MAG TPA: NAD(P)/FAD-dependent oxidoreductase [Gammaproteobacteria bacterium]|jgi:cation diffusion facilitator CzcD-associated flavoprotein CzcO